MVPLMPNQNPEEAGTEDAGMGDREEKEGSGERQLVLSRMTNGAIWEDLERGED
jgi:hypothetical protein